MSPQFPSLSQRRLFPCTGSLIQLAKIRKSFFGIGLLQNLGPGTLVRHPTEPDWGLGQVQSVIGNRVTVNFEHRGKMVIVSDQVDLEVIAEESAM